MQRRHGRYGITDQQRRIWLIIIGATATLGVFLAGLCVVLLVASDDFTFPLLALPLAGMLIFGSAIMGYGVLGGTPPQPPATR